MRKPDPSQVTTEAAEARWWFEHRDELAQDMVTASRSGRRGTGVAERLKQKIEQEQQEQAPRRTAEQLS